MARKKKDAENASQGAPFADNGVNTDKPDEPGKAVKDDKPSTIVEDSEEKYPGREGVVGPEQVQEALNVFRQYKEAKTSIENRAVANEQWYRQRYA